MTIRQRLALSGYLGIVFRRVALNGEAGAHHAQPTTLRKSQVAEILLLECDDEP
jgi:hypothetical protein